MRTLRWGLAVLSLAAAAIHFAVIGDHFSEWWLTGAFFTAVAWAQALWAVLVIARPSRPLYLAGAVGNAAVVLVWIVSRTVGIPIGPEAGEAEAVNFIDTLATAYEILIVVGIALLMRLESRSQRVGRLGSIVDNLPAPASPDSIPRPKVLALAGSGATLAITVLTAAALVSVPPGGHGHIEDTHEDRMVPAVAGSHEEGPIEGTMDRPASSASIEILEPADGAEVDHHDAPVHVRLIGGTLADHFSSALTPDEGHIHLRLNGETIATDAGLEENVAELLGGDISPGAHVLEAEFVALDGDPFSPPVIARVSFTAV